MGLLDDAIKEHLDLKRRRGADPGEVERLEREALGPVRRGSPAAEEAVLDREDVEHLEPEAVLYDDRADDDFGEPPELADEPAFADEAVRDGEHEPFPEDESERGWSHEPTEAWDVEEPLAADDPLAAEEPLAAEHEPAAEAPAEGAPARPTPPPGLDEPRSDHPGEETVEYDVEAEEVKGGEDDPLEETPEFLQDTPDHDRLWFEQRPPKDFDFDK